MDALGVPPICGSPQIKNIPLLGGSSHLVSAYCSFFVEFSRLATSYFGIGILRIRDLPSGANLSFSGKVLNPPSVLLFGRYLQLWTMFIPMILANVDKRITIPQMTINHQRSYGHHFPAMGGLWHCEVLTHPQIIVDPSPNNILASNAHEL